MKKIDILFKNGREIFFKEKDLDCSKLTLEGHASAIIHEWSKGSKTVFSFDGYNAVLLDEVVSIQIIL